MKYFNLRNLGYFCLDVLLLWFNVCMYKNMMYVIKAGYIYVFRNV